MNSTGNNNPNSAAMAELVSNYLAVGLRYDAINSTFEILQTGFYWLVLCANFPPSIAANTSLVVDARREPEYPAYFNVSDVILTLVTNKNAGDEPETVQVSNIRHLTEGDRLRKQTNYDGKASDMTMYFSGFRLNSAVSKDVMFKVDCYTAQSLTLTHAIPNIDNIEINKGGGIWKDNFYIVPQDGAYYLALNMYCATDMLIRGVLVKVNRKKSYCKLLTNRGGYNDALKVEHYNGNNNVKWYSNSALVYLHANDTVQINLDLNSNAKFTNISQLSFSGFLYQYSSQLNTKAAWMLDISRILPLGNGKCMHYILVLIPIRKISFLISTLCIVYH